MVFTLLTFKLVYVLGEITTVIDKITIGAFSVDFTSYLVSNLETGEKHDLSKREIDLLKLFNSKQGLVISRDEILDALWGNDQFPTSRTIDNYILNFRKIFESDPKSPKYFHSIRGVGYKFVKE